MIVISFCIALKLIITPFSDRSLFRGAGRVARVTSETRDTPRASSFVRSSNLKFAANAISSMSRYERVSEKQCDIRGMNSLGRK